MIKFDAHSSFTIAIFGSLLDEYEIQKNYRLTYQFMIDVDTSLA